MNDFSYWQKQTKKSPLYADLIWNLPEQKQGTISVIGGNSQSFAVAYRTSEFLTNRFLLKEVQLVLPDSLRTSVPPLENITLTPSTESGSFAKSSELESACAHSDTNLFIGDLSKNSATAITIADILVHTERPTTLARDTIDLVSQSAAGFIERPNLTIVASAAQLQKLLRALYYPRMIMLSMPLTALIETLHKFTLSYPCTLITFHAEQIIVAHAGIITTTPITDTTYTPLALWNGQLAATATAISLFNPNKSLESATAAILFS